MNRPVFERIIVRLRLVFLIVPLIFRSVVFSCPVVDATPLPFVQVERGKIYSRSRCREFFFSFVFLAVQYPWTEIETNKNPWSLLYWFFWFVEELYTFSLSHSEADVHFIDYFPAMFENFNKKIYRKRKNIYFRLRLWNFFVRFSRRSVSLNWNWVKEEPLKSSVLIFCLLRNLPASALRTGIPINEQIIFPQNTLVWYIFNTRALVAPKYFLSFLYGYTVIIYCFRTFMTR